MFIDTENSYFNAKHFPVASTFPLGIGCLTLCGNLTLLHKKSHSLVRNVTKADGRKDYNTSESFVLKEIIVSFVLNECQNSTN